jgi:hypothetical protein
MWKATIEFAAALGTVLLVAGSPAVASPVTVFDFSYSSLDASTPFSGQGQFFTHEEGTLPYYDVFNVNGIANIPNSSSIITGVSGYASADNRLYFPAQDSPPRFVDGQGISFSTVAGGDFNLYFNGLEFVGTARISSSLDPFGVGPGTLIQLNVAPVPLPPALALFGSALAGVAALFGWRRRRRSLALA